MAKRTTRKPAAAPAPEPVAQEAQGAARRTSARRRPRARVPVLDTETREEIGRLLDLSDSGLRLEGAKALRDGLDRLVDCSTPDDPGRHARIGVKVRWSSPGVASGRFEAGLQVKAMVQRDAEALRGLYARLAAAARE